MFFRGIHAISAKKMPMNHSSHLKESKSKRATDKLPLISSTFLKIIVSICKHYRASSGMSSIQTAGQLGVERKCLTLKAKDCAREMHAMSQTQSKELGKSFEVIWEQNLYHHYKLYKIRVIGNSKHRGVDKGLEHAHAEQYVLTSSAMSRFRV